MTISILRKLVKLFKLNALVNKEYDDSILIEYWFKNNDKLSIYFLPLLLSKFVLYKKYKQRGSIYNSIEIELLWIYINYIYYYENNELSNTRG